MTLEDERRAIDAQIDSLLRKREELRKDLSAVDIQTIIIHVAAAFNVPTAKMSESRRRAPARARHVAMYLAWRLGHHDKHIGHIFRRDRTTVIQGRQLVEDHMDTEPDLKVEVEKLERELKKA